MEEEEDFFNIAAMVSQMNMAPPVLGHGISFLAGYTGGLVEYKADSDWV